MTSASRSRRSIRWLFLSTPAVLASACGEPPTTLEPLPEAPATIAVTPDAVVLMEGNTLQLAAVVRGSAGSDLESSPIKWYSTNPDVARVSTDGLLVARSIGRALTVAIAGEARDTVIVDVQSLFRSISAGSNHTCAVSTRGRAYCWGGGGLGRRGDGTDVARAVPTAVRTDVAFHSISAGRATSCGVAGADAYCWGNNGSGQLGTGIKGDAWAPVRVAAGFAFRHIVVNSMHACGLSLTGVDDAAAGGTSQDFGTAFCWGADWAGQLGDGYAPTNPLPQPIVGDHRVTTLDVGMFFSCAVEVDGTAYCWGFDDRGQLGQETAQEDCAHLDGRAASCSTLPVPVFGDLAFRTIATGAAHACGLEQDGTAHCWGDNRFGQLGDGSTMSRRTPVVVSGGLRFSELTTGDRHTCGLTAAGIAFCWGSNAHGALGAPSATLQCNGQPCSMTPVEVDGAMIFLSLSASRGNLGSHTCGVTAEHVAYCWGDNADGQLGTGSRGGVSATPVRVTGQPN